MGARSLQPYMTSVTSRKRTAFIASRFISVWGGVARISSLHVWTRAWVRGRRGSVFFCRDQEVRDREHRRKFLALRLRPQPVKRHARRLRQLFCLSDVAQEGQQVA